jgi:hypothetical protein
MRRAIAPVGAAVLAVVLLRRRRRGRRSTVVVGYADGSTVTLEESSAGRERLLDLARVALTR